jgi:hypothetical protein
MQIKAIALYNADGDQQVIRLQPRALNVITGISKTGKSALLDIVEFGLGRSTITVPVGPITNTVTWYGLLLEMDGGDAFVGRPAGRQGAASQARAMLAFGVDDVPEFGDLDVNADAATVREELGTRIGIDENRGEPAPWMEALEANLGHAVLLTLQGQGEVANRNQLFHRANEEGVARAIQNTLPYFLGAWPADQALKRQQLALARRDLKRAQGDLVRAEQLNAEIDAALYGLLAEAHAQGLVESADITDRVEIIAALKGAIERQSERPPLDDEQVEANRELERERDRLRRELRQVADERGLLSDEGANELDYTRAVETQLTRLSSLDLLGSDGGDADSTHCVVCGSELSEPDPTSAELRGAVEQLQAQLADVQAARPRREAVLAELSAHAEKLREQLRGTEAALSGLAATREAADGARQRAEEQAFTKGRIDQYLSSIAVTEDAAMRRLREAVSNGRRRVEALEADLDPERVQDELVSRLAAVSNDMTRYANALELEHARGTVRLDLGRLTVVTDTDTGPAPLMRIGSGENWVGYHLATHLALHRFFARRERPVPRFLMLDQPTQVFYPSDVEIEAGIPAGEETRQAVRRLYEVMRDFVAELDGAVQLIVCDHANLPGDWFQQAVRENWRDGRKLIPDQWIQGAGSAGL